MADGLFDSEVPMVQQMAASQQLRSDSRLAVRQMFANLSAWLVQREAELDALDRDDPEYIFGLPEWQSWLRYYEQIVQVYDED